MPRRPWIRFCSAVFVPAAMAVAVYAATPKEAQQARHEHYEELGDAFKAVRDNARGDSPDWAALDKATQTVVAASIDQQQWFAKGTGPEAGKTRALPEIWSKPDDFTAAQKMFTDRAPKLLAAVKAKDARRRAGGLQGSRRRLQELPRHIPRSGRMIDESRRRPGPACGSGTCRRAWFTG